MKKILKTVLVTLVSLMMFVTGTPVCAEEEIHEIKLGSKENSDGTYSHTVTVDGNAVSEYDYVWHADPTIDHDEVKNSPAEYFTGEKPEGEDIYIAHDIYYYPELDADKFVKKSYDGEYEWLYYYEAEGYEDYIFSTLPVEGNTVPTRMMHSEEEAYQNAVLHINKAGTYRLSGNWHGQVNIDLGEDSFTDPEAVVTLILDGADIECTVASGICFYQVYEVDNAWEDREEALTEIDTTGAGANIVIADGSTNTVSGANIFRILKTKYKDEDSTDEVKVQKKSKKVDGAFYSYMSMNIDGEEKGTGILNINSEFEGLDTELHLTINGGNINITADNDGINVNEDDVSIVTINGGKVQILAGTGAEGDGVDSNGYININGGTVISSAKPQSDSGLDSSCGTYINGGTVIATGSSMDVVTEYSENADQVTLNLVFNSQQNLTDSIIIADTDSKPVFAYDLSKNDFFKDAGRTYQCLIVSDDSFTVNDEYNIYIGGQLKGDETDGIYQNAKSFTNASQLFYTSTGVTGGPGMFGGFGGMQQEGNFNPEDIPEGFDPENIPEGFDPENVPEGMEQGNFNPEDMPEGFNPDNMTGATENKQAPEGTEQGERPEMPEGQNMEKPDNNGQMQNMQKPDGNSQMQNMEKPDGNGQMQNMSQSSSEAKTVFLVEDKVNTYSGVYPSDAAVVSSSSSVSYTLPIVIASSVVVIAAVVLILVKINKKKTS